MLKFLRTLTMLALMLVPVVSQGQVEVTVGSLDGATANTYLPMNSLYNYSYTQQIYTAEEIGMSGTINSITVWMYGNTDLYEMPMTIFMMEVDKEAFSGNTDWVTVTEADIVYTGSVTVHNTTAEAYTFELTTPFVYTGTSNLLIAVNNTTGSWKSGLNGMVFGTSGDPVRAIYARQDGGAYNPYNPTFSANSTTYQRNVITFDINPGEITCTKPYDLDSSDVTYDGFVLSWSDTNDEGTTFTINEMVNGEEVLVATGIEGTSYTFTGLAANSQHTYKLYANCDVEDQSYAATFTIKTPCGPMSLPYTEDFEGIAQNGAWPDCWNLILSHNTDPSANYVNNHTTGGQYSMYISTGYNDSNMFATAAVPLAGNNIYVKFWVRLSSNSYYNSWVQAGVMTDLEDPSTFIPLATVNSNRGSWQQVEFTTADLDEDATYYVAWLGYTGTTGDYYSSSVDDIYIDEIPDCMHVTGLAGTSTSNSITLNWGASANEDALFNIYKAVNVTEEDGQGGTTTTTVYEVVAAGVDTNTYTVTDLNDDTNYVLGVSVQCGEVETDTIFVTVRTLSAANAITAFNATGAMVRGDLEFDAEAHTAVVPVWYATTLNNLTLSWTISAGAAFAVDTADDGSFTCIVNTSTLKNYLRVNVPTTVRLYAEDRNVYTDYTLLLQSEECVADRNLTFSAERIRLTAMWQNPDTLVTVHNIICSPVALDAEALATAEYITVEDTMAYTFEGLERNTQYYVYVKSACATEWVSGTVTTRALGADLEVVVADGTTTNGYVPVYGLYADNYQKSHFVYPASQLTELNGQAIPQMTFYLSSPATVAWTGNFKVYVGEVDYTTISAYADVTTLTEVYSGTLDATGSTMTITFNAPYAYNGGNLLVAFEEDVKGNYKSASFYGVTANGASVQGYSYSSLSGVSASQRNFLPKFSTSISMPVDACPQVTEIATDSISHDFAAISWTSADADYCVGNQIVVSSEMIEDFEGVEPVELEATATSYNATGLLADHDYYIYIKTLCNGEAHDEGTSGWATYTFHTYPSCRVADQLSAEITGKHTATISWVNNGAAVGQADNFDVLVSTILYNEEEMLVANPSYTGVAATSLDLIDLMSDPTYYFYVRNVNEELECTAAWSEPFAFHTVEAMPAPAIVEVSYIAHNAMTANWMRNDAEFANETSWRVAIALHGEEPTDWTIVNDYVMNGDAVIGSYAFLGLTPETAYDVYVAPYDTESETVGEVYMVDSVVTNAFPPACHLTEAESYTSNSYLPVYGYYADADQVNQMLYPASMLSDIAGKSITSMHYYVESGSSNGWDNPTITVKLAEVEAATLGGALMTDVEQTTVFTGTVTATVEDGMVITFAEPYVYNGGNLLVEFDLATEDGYSSCAFYAFASENASVYTYNGNVIGQNYLPAVDFCYLRESTCLDVNNVFVGGITSNSAELNWYPGNEENTWQYFVTNNQEELTEAIVEAGAITLNDTPELVLTNLERDTTYYFVVRAVCSDEESSDWRVFSFRTEFELYDFNVNVEVEADHGTVEGAGHYTEGETATLTAIPAEGYYFVGWSNGDEIVSEENPYEFVVNEDVDLEAVFAIYTYTMTVTANDEEMGSVEGMPETETIDYGTEVILTAVANEGYRFVNWSNELTEETITVVVTSDTALVANFEAIPTYTVTVVATEGGSVTNAGENTVYEGETFTATATADEGYHFVGWSNGDTSATVTITVTASITLTATFEADPQPVNYTITVEYDENMGTVNGAGTYQEGATVTLTATPNAGYEFVGWSNGETSTTITFVATQDITLTATFGLVGINDVDMDNVSIYSVDSKIVVRGAEGNSVYVFDVNGRMLNRVNNASDMVEFRMEQTGVYLVKVGNAAAKRVVVVR